MATKTEIANLAISHLGIGKEIQNIDTDKSEEASACRRFFDSSRDELLRSYTWSFATKFYTLGLIESNPNTEWDYSYRYPSNAIFIKRILSGNRNDTEDSRVPYKIAKDDTFRLIFTDAENAVAEIIESVTDTSFYPPDFVMALSYKLAFNIAARVTAGDPFGARKQMNDLYMAEASKAFTNDLNEQKDDLINESKFIRERY